MSQTDEDYWGQLCTLAESERDEERKRADETEKNLSELHVRLRQVLGVESVDEAFEMIGWLFAARADRDDLDAECNKMRGAHDSALKEVARLNAELADHAGWREAAATSEHTISWLYAERAEINTALDDVGAPCLSKVLSTAERIRTLKSAEVAAEEKTAHHARVVRLNDEISAFCLKVADCDARIAELEHALSVSESNLSQLNLYIRDAFAAVMRVRKSNPPQPDLTPAQIVDQLRDLAYDVEKDIAVGNEAAIQRTTNLIKMLRREVADRDALVLQLEVEISALEDHIDAIDRVAAIELDCWADWDTER